METVITEKTLPSLEAVCMPGFTWYNRASESTYRVSGYNYNQGVITFAYINKEGLPVGNHMRPAILLKFFTMGVCQEVGPISYEPKPEEPLDVCAFLLKIKQKIEDYRGAVPQASVFNKILSGIRSDVTEFMVANCKHLTGEPVNP
jgi:hypothetical protein